MRALSEELYTSSNKTKNKCFKYESQLNSALRSLDVKERSVLFLRFWVPCSIEEVSQHMHISWAQADRLLEKTLEKLKAEFRSQGLLPEKSQSPFPK